MRITPTTTGSVPINGSELLREGEPPPNGVGALRRVKVRPLSFEEEITAYERPTRLDYLIVKLNVPLEHDGGAITLDTRRAMRRESTGAPASAFRPR